MLGAKAEVRMQEVIGVRVRILLLLIGAPKTFSASLSLAIEAKLQQVYGLAI